MPALLLSTRFGPTPVRRRATMQLSLKRLRRNRASAYVPCGVRTQTLVRNSLSMATARTCQADLNGSTRTHRCAANVKATTQTCRCALPSWLGKSSEQEGLNNTGGTSGVDGPRMGGHVMGIRT